MGEVAGSWQRGRKQGGNSSRVLATGRTKRQCFITANFLSDLQSRYYEPQFTEKETCLKKVTLSGRSRILQPMPAAQDMRAPLGHTTFGTTLMTAQANINGAICSTVKTHVKYVADSLHPQSR